MELFAGHSPPTHLLWIPVAYLGTGRAIAGRTTWGRRVDVVGGIAVDVLSRDVSAWIPAFAGMTNGGVRWHTRKQFERIPERSLGHAFVPIAHAGCRRHTNV